MKRTILFIAIVSSVVLLTPQHSSADRWASPEIERTFASQNRQYLLVLVEKEQASLTLESIKHSLWAGPRHGIFKDASGKIIFEKDFEFNPLNVFVSNDGKYLVFVDVYGPNIGFDEGIGIYDGKDGSLIQKIPRSYFLTTSETISSNHWFKKTWISHDDKQFILTNENNDRYEFDLKTGDRVKP